MATLAGNAFASPVWAINAPSSASSSLQAANFAPQPFVLAETVTAKNAVAVSVSAFPAGVSLKAAIANTFIGDYYDRFHLYPSEVAFGTMATPQTGTFSIWNAYRSQQSMAGMSAVGNTGLTLPDLPATPFNIAPLAYSSYTINAAVDGPAVINATYTFTFGTGQQLTLPVTGLRMVMWPFKPNWGQPVNESYEWKTDIIRARNGKEQRRTLRMVPRRAFEYQFHAVGREARLAEDMLWGWHNKNFLVPVWNDPAKLTSDVSAGALALPCATDTLSFAVNQMAVIYQDTFNYEIVQVNSVQPTQLLLKYRTQKQWSAGVRVFPAVIGHFATSVPTQRYTSEVLTGQVIFSTSPDQTNSGLPVAAASVTYDGLEVLTSKPNWGQQMQNDFTREFFTTDAGTGPIAYYNKEAYSRMVRPYTFLLKNRTDVDNFRAFLQRMSGQAKACWIPSWHSDFKVIGDIAAVANTITVEGTEFFELVGLDTSRDRIMLRLTDGTYFFRRITGVSVNSGNTVLTIDSQLGQLVQNSRITALHILLRCRLASDKVIIPWRTDRVADPQLTFTTIPQ